MNEQRILGQQQPAGWTVWASAFAGALIAFTIGELTGTGSGEVFQRPGQAIGFAMGSGLLIALLVWLVFNFTTLRGWGWPRRLAVLLLITLGGTLGVMQNL